MTSTPDSLLDDFFTRTSPSPGHRGSRFSLTSVLYTCSSCAFLGMHLYARRSRTMARSSSCAVAGAASASIRTIPSSIGQLSAGTTSSHRR